MAKRTRKDPAFKMRSKGGLARALLPAERLTEIGRKGGEARRDAMTPEARSAAARAAVVKRWADAAAVALARKTGKAGGPGFDPLESPY